MGNQLQTKGAAEFIRPIMAVSEINEEFPMLTKLLMQDNAIDSSGDEELFGPVTCMRAFRRLCIYYMYIMNVSDVTFLCC